MTKNIKEFIDPSKKHEQLLVGFMWNNPQLYRKYKNHNITKDTFTESMWYWYYKLGERMWENGVRSFDEETVYSFIDSRSDSKVKIKKYNEYGAYETIGFLKEHCTKEKQNDEYHLNEMQKYEALRNLIDLGLIEKSNKELIKKLGLMSLKQVQQFFNHKYKDSFKNINSGQVDIVDLIDDSIYEAIEEAKKGTSMGTPFFHAPKLTKLLKGWLDGRLYYLAMPSGVGKSTMTRAIFIMTLLTENQKGIVFVNEESRQSWQISLLSVVSTYIKKKKIKRDKIFEGGFDKDTEDALKEAADWLNENRPDMLKLIVLKKFRFEDILNYAEYYRAHGCQKMIIDTFKPDDSGSDMARWESFSNQSQSLYDLIKPENLNMGTLATLQLKIGKAYRFLDNETIGKSKEVVEVADAIMLGRLIYADEYEGEKNAIFAFNWGKGNNKWVKEKYELKEDKEYMIVFLSKNRMGSTQRQVIFEINYDFNELIEVAYAELKPTAPTGF